MPENNPFSVDAVVEFSHPSNPRARRLLAQIIFRWEDYPSAAAPVMIAVRAIAESSRGDRDEINGYLAWWMVDGRRSCKSEAFDVPLP